MALPPAGVDRTPLHTRSIQIDAFRRNDGLWDLEARLTDVKHHDFKLNSGLRPAGSPVHDMRLRITVDESLTIVDAVAVHDAVPYPGSCESITPAYRDLVGLNLLKSFRREVKARFAGRAGCTHLSELCGVLPTAAVQAFGAELRRRHHDDMPPFFLDQCHALRRDGAVVRQYYPRWHVSAERDAGRDAPETTRSAEIARRGDNESS